MPRLSHLALSLTAATLTAATLTASALFGGVAAAAAPGASDPYAADSGAAYRSASSWGGADFGAADRTAVRGGTPAWATAAADRGPVPDATALTARVGLAGRDPAGLAAYASAVSTPGDALYRKFLTPQQVRDRYGPTAAQTAAVRAWLTAAGLTVRGANQHWIDVAGPASAMRRAFGVRIDQYSVAGSPTATSGTATSNSAAPDSTDLGARALRAPSGPATVPAQLAGAVSSVSGLTEVARGMHEGATGALQAEAAMNPGSRRPGDAREGASSAHPDERDRPAAPVSPDAADPAQPPCSPDWGAVAAVGYPAGYSAAEPLDVCGYQPSQLRGAYGVTASGLTGRGVTVAVVDAYASPTMRADADTYAARHGDRPFAAGQYEEYVTQSQWTHTADGVCQTPSDWSGEESLDVEMAHGVAPDATVRYFGANSCADDDLAAVMARIVDSKLADFVAGSFGETMHDTNGDVDPAMVAQENQVFTTGAAEGIGFSVSSGDCGDDAPGLAGPNCDPLSSRAQTEWPASSPWVTAVGGTALAATSGGAYQWETSMGDRRSVLTPDGRAWDPFPGAFYFGGGGGTSEDFTQPAYQAGVVPDAMARALGTGKTSSKPMRTVPDVAMNGDLLTAVDVGQTDPATGRYSETQVGGTSVSAPMFAAMLADAAQGARGPLGFVNPALYARAGSGRFADVVDHPAAAPDPVSTVLDLGLNADGSRKVRLYELGQDHGLSAVAGYDRATGLGSPGAGFLGSFGG